MPSEPCEGAQVDPVLFQGHDWHILVVGCKGYAVSIGTIYLDCGLGIQGPNVTKLSSLTKALKILGRPYVIVGDFNVEPHIASEQGIGMISDARIVVPPNVLATYQGKTLIDYALVSHDLFGLVTVKAAQDTPWASHLGLVIGIPTRARQVLARFVRNPRCFPHGGRPKGDKPSPEGAAEVMVEASWDTGLPEAKRPMAFEKGKVDPFLNHVLSSDGWEVKSRCNGGLLQQWTNHMEDYYCKSYKITTQAETFFPGTCFRCRARNQASYCMTSPSITCPPLPSVGMLPLFTISGPDSLK